MPRSWKRLEISQNPLNFSLRRYFQGVLKGMNIGFQFYRKKYFLFKIGRYF